MSILIVHRILSGKSKKSMMNFCPPRGRGY